MILVRCNIRNVNNQLFISIAHHLGLRLQSLRPRLLEDGLAGAVHLLVQRGDLVKVDLLVQRELHGGRDVVRVVMLCPAHMVVVVVVVFVVAVVRHCV